LSVVPISTSQIQRAGIEISRIIWCLDARDAAQHVTQLFKHFSCPAGLWVYIPSTIPDTPLLGIDSILKQNVDEPVSLIVGLTAESIRRRLSNPLQDRLKLLGVSSCAAVMLEDVDVLDVKSGWPFHRLGALRDQGLLKMFFTEAHDIAAAEWLVEHSPTYGVSVPFGIDDQSVKFRLLQTAQDLGTAIFARSTGRNSADDIRLRASEQGVAAQIESLPHGNDELQRMIAALQHPMHETDRAKLWEDYRSGHAEPVKLRSAHPPEFGA
jgi:hypothetical protein